MHSIDHYVKEFNSHLEKNIHTKEPLHLYEPINYILSLGGKRLRPALTLLTADLFGGAYKEANYAAMAIEIFHNFSLIHDDIMDGAPLRRGQQTVHTKWDVNTGILSGDAMLISAYRCLEHYSKELFKELTQLFSKTALEVCEGQQLDMDFETAEEVAIADYIKMITYKTAVLVAAAMKMGGMIAQAKDADLEHIYEFGKNLGIAFQLQDDYLDVFGDPDTFGKQLGGDIIENKKTYLYLKTLELSDPEKRQELKHLLSIQPTDPSSKIKTVSDAYESTGAAEATKAEIEKYTQKAFASLEPLDLNDAKKQVLREFGERLMSREF